MGKQTESKKVQRLSVAVKPSIFEKADGTVMNHRELFAALAVESFGHGHPSPPKKRAH